MKGLISEEEFDRLPEQSQMQYLYCAKCGKFYLRLHSSHNMFTCPSCEE